MKQIVSMECSSSLKKHNFYYISFFLILFFLGSFQKALAQKKMEKLPGPIIVCPANFEDQHSRMAMKQLALKNNTLKSVSNATADIQITFGPGAQDNEEVQAAFEFALGIWAQEIVSSVPIRISADFQDLGTGVLASAGPTQIFQNFPNAPQEDIFYPSALANTLAGEILDPNLEFDLVVNIGNGIPWYFGTDGNTPAGQFDFVTVALHEVGHGLGFFDGGNVDATGIGTLGFGGGIPVIFDLFVVDGQENSVLDLPNPSLELGDFYTSGDVFLNGPNAVEALGGNLPEVFAPNPFQGGSSIAHWDEATFPAGDINSLMSPQVGASESNFDIGPITRGHFSDMGWPIAGQSSITFNPSSLNEELNIEETVTREITVTNTSDSAVSIQLVQPTDPFSIVTAVTPDQIEIAAGVSEIITVTLSTVGVPRGDFLDTIEFTVSDFDQTLSIPINIRVLDGTEAPSIIVTPESFDETLNQFLTVSRALTLENIGTADLNYSITIDDETPTNFESRVALTKAAITTKGFVQESPSFSSITGISAAIQNNNPLNRLVSSLYATDFEEFNLGELDQQQGWASIPLNFNTISDANPFGETQHIRGVSDGSGTLGLAFSPLITTGNEPFTVATAQLNIETTGANFEFIPQSNVDGSVVTRVRFNADGTIDVLNADTGVFDPTGTLTPQGYFEVRLVLDRDNLGTSVFIDDTLIHSGTGFSGNIDQIVLLSDNLVAGSIFDVDNVEVIDGDENAFFLSVSPINGTITDGGNQTLEVLFDTRAIAPGEYNATINVNSDDPENPSIDVPVSLTVTVPPTITVTPNSISASVDVNLDNPPVANSSFTISNGGDSPLNFTTSIGQTTFTSPDSLQENTLIKELDMQKYGVGNAKNHLYTSTSVQSKALKINPVSEILENATTFNDSIFYDTGISFPDSFGGLDGPALTTAVRFDVDRDFTLTAVRNAYTTETLSDATIILEIYRGGTDPSNAELLLQQTTTALSENGTFLVEELITPLSFSPGEFFWVVHKYPEGISFPQGQDNDTSNVRPNTYFFSTDGGATFTNIDAFVFLKRALSGGSGDADFITLAPSSGIVAPGESINVDVSFDGTNLPNGIHETDITVNSNDPITPASVVATSFEVSGQSSAIEISDEFLLFNNVFVGDTAETTFTISNTGLATLNISEILSDNPDFSVEPNSTIIQAGQEQEVTVSFAPSSTGSINGIITVLSDGSNSTSLEIIVNGIGVDPPIAILSPEEIFETTDEGVTVDTEVILRNDGNSPLIFSFPELAVANALADPNIQLNNTSPIAFENFSSTPQKGFIDNRSGHLVEFSLGTDLEFGYSWIDSDQDGGPIYVPFDISEQGTEITDIVGADGTAEIALPFSFNFYGIEYETLFVNANGFVAFQEPDLFSFINQQIPNSTDNVNNIIAGFWADIEPQNGGAVHVSAEDDLMVIQYTNAPIFFGNDEETVSFKILLHSDGVIEVFYDDVDQASFLDQATVGIENAEGTDGAQVAFNTPYVRDGLAVRFIPPSVANVNIISAISSTSGVVPAGGSRTLAVTLDPMDLPSGIYADQLTVSSNAPDKSNSTVDIELTVNDVLEVTGFTLINADTDAEIGPLNEGDIINISEIGTRNFNVVAAINDVEIGSVVFDFNETIAFSTENVAPYALGGDRSGDFRPLSFDIGANTITATPFSESRGGGDAGISNTVNFEVISGTETLNLVNANTNEIISSLSDGDIIDLNDFPSTTELSILAETEIANIGSILFDFNGESAFQIENLAPYALNGGSLNTSNPVAFIPGINTVTANVHSGRRGGGSILGSISISFEVIPVTGGTELIGTKVYPNPITSNTSFITIENNTKQNLNSTLYNVLGQIVYSGKDFDINAQGNAVLKTIELPIGAYILRLTDDTGTIVSQLKLIKQ